jgi:hypothetical protein
VNVYPAPREIGRPSTDQTGTESRRVFIALTSIVALVAFAAVMATSAAAAPMFNGPAPNSFSLASVGHVIFDLSEPVQEVNCKEATGTGSFSGPASGSFAGELISCKENGIECETANPKFEGSLELVQITPTITGIAIIPKEISVVCGTKHNTYKYKGAFLGTISPVNVKTNLFSLVFEASSTIGTPKYHTCEVGAVCGKDVHLEGSLNGSAFRTAAMKTAQSISLTMTQAATIVK